MFDEGLYQLLAADVLLTDIIAGRIFQGAAPDDRAQYPCIAYSMVGGSADPTMATSGVIRQRVEINALAFDPEVTKNIADRILLDLPGWNQKLFSGIRVLDVLLLNPGTDFVTEQRMFRRLAEFYVFYTLPS